MADLATRARRRSTARLIKSALAGLPSLLDDPEFWKPIVEALQQGATDTDDVRGSAQCASVLSALRAQQIRLLENLDKVQRLNDGRPTDIVARIRELAQRDGLDPDEIIREAEAIARGEVAP